MCSIPSPSFSSSSYSWFSLHLLVLQPLKCLGTLSGYSREGQGLGGDWGGVKTWGVCGPDVWAFMRLGRGSSRGRQRSGGGGTWLFSITMINGGEGRVGELEGAGGHAPLFKKKKKKDCYD